MATVASTLLNRSQQRGTKTSRSDSSSRASELAQPSSSQARPRSVVFSHRASTTTLYQSRASAIRLTQAETTAPPSSQVIAAPRQEALVPLPVGGRLCHYVDAWAPLVISQWHHELVGLNVAPRVFTNFCSRWQPTYVQRAFTFTDT